MVLKYKIKNSLKRFLLKESSLNDLYGFIHQLVKNKIRLIKLIFLIIFASILEVVSISLVAISSFINR